MVQYTIPQKIKNPEYFGKYPDLMEKEWFLVKYYSAAFNSFRFFSRFIAILAL